MQRVTIFNSAQFEIYGVTYALTLAARSYALLEHIMLGPIGCKEGWGISLPETERKGSVSQGGTNSIHVMLFLRLYLHRKEMSV